VTTRTINVQVFVDSDTIGSGTIEYTDDAVPSFTELYMDRCVPQTLCIDSECYKDGAVFCYRDTLAKGQGGVAETTLSIPIEVDGVTAGEAELPFIDAYAGVIQVAPLTQLVSVLVLVLLVWLAVVALKRNKFWLGMCCTGGSNDWGAEDFKRCDSKCCQSNCKDI